GVQPGEEARPPIVVQDAKISCQAGVNEAEPCPAGVIAARCERDLDTRAAWWQPEAEVGPAPGENQPAGPLHHHVPPLAELAGHHLEAEPPARAGLKVGRDTDPADQL